MQERDEDLAWAYDEIDWLKKKNHEKNIWIFGLSAAIAFILLFLVLSLRKK